jgi:hypothetical protein
LDMRWHHWYLSVVWQSPNPKACSLLMTPDLNRRNHKLLLSRGWTQSGRVHKFCSWKLTPQKNHLFLTKLAYNPTPILKKNKCNSTFDSWKKKLWWEKYV